MSEDCRQHYRLATGEGLTAAPPKNPTPGFKKGGRVVGFKKGGQNKAGSHGHSFPFAGKRGNS
jgi:hypothetical protein